MNEPTPERVAQALDDAADLILIHGWAQHDPMIRQGSNAVCVQEALARVLGVADWSAVPYDDVCPVGAAAVAAMQANGCVPTTKFDDGVWSWNDTEGRTEDEVHDALRSTAKKLREGELSL